MKTEESERKQPSLREDVLEFAKEQYGTEPECPWKSMPDYQVLRHGKNRKWYALFMIAEREKLGLDSGGYTDLVELKCDPGLAGSLLSRPGILPARRMHRENWITVLLDGTVEREQIFSLLDLSFSLTAGWRRENGNRDWLIPANPAYYDIEQAFAKNRVIEWKQSSRVAVGDIVYIYMAAPVSAVLYRCRAVEVDIPREYDSGKVHMSRVMKLELLHRYRPEEFQRGKLKSFGVYAVRGPRGVPAALRKELEVCAGAAGKTEH